MDLTPEDDDLLSYFLSADVAAERMPASASAGAASGTDQFAVSQSAPLPHERAFGAPAASAANAAGSGAASAGVAGSVSAFQQMSAGFGASEMSGPRSTTDDETPGAGDTDEKRQRRLARNRESARQSRRRKKQYLELLEEKVSQLTESIDATRASHLERADEALSSVRSEILATLAENLKNAGSEETAAEKVRQGIMLIQERFGPNSVERLAVKDYNFRQLDNLLLPPYCRFLLWLSIQDDSFFDEASNLAAKSGASEGVEKKKTPAMVKKDTLWPTLTGDLSLTYEQDEKLKSLYKSGEAKAGKSERRRVALAVNYLSKLKKSLEQRSEAVQRHTEMLHSILTPEQSLTYLRWVDANQNRLPTFVDKTISVKNTGTSEAVRAILNKNDRDLTVEDVTALLGEL